MVEENGWYMWWDNILKMMNINKYLTFACSTIEIEYRRELYNMTKQKTAN